MLIAGLGNPDKKYELTRHNAGFMILDKSAEKLNVTNFKHKFNSLIYTGNIKNNKFVLLKPLTYMNLSGESISKTSKYYNIPVNKILVIHDDADLDFGIIKLRHSGSCGGHNGLLNIVHNLKSSDFFRLRFGVGPRIRGLNLSDFVLSNFFEEDQESLITHIDKASDIVLNCITMGILNAINVYKKIIDGEPNNERTA